MLTEEGEWLLGLPVAARRAEFHRDPRQVPCLPGSFTCTATVIISFVELPPQNVLLPFPLIFFLFLGRLWCIWRASAAWFYIELALSVYFCLSVPCEAWTAFWNTTVADFGDNNTDFGLQPAVFSHIINVFFSLSTASIVSFYLNFSIFENMFTTASLKDTGPIYLDFLCSALAVKKSLLCWCDTIKFIIIKLKINPLLK